MKNKIKLLGITALIAVMVFAMTACDNGSQGVEPAITTTALPNGEAGTAYNQTLTATGDTPITWTIDTGSLPDGLELSEAGEITGTPTTAGTFNFTVKAENATGDDIQALSIFIAPEGGDDIIINIAAITGVTAPVQGASPVTAITANDQYTGTVQWNGNPTTFAYETVYTATITLTAKTGYTLTGVTENFFTVAGTSAPATNAANSGVITAVFPQTEEDTSLLHLSGTISIIPNTNVYAGTELTASYSGSDYLIIDPLIPTYTWEKDSVHVHDGSTYTPTMPGSYTVTIHVTGYNSKTSAAVTVSLANLSGNISISPNTNVNTGTELTATYTGGETVSYQWKKDGVAIDGETGATYTPTEAGSYTVTVSLTGYNSKTSDAVNVVVPVFTDVVSLAAYLANLPDNDAATPYSIKMNVASLPTGSGDSENYSDLQKALNKPNKYVRLDLSGSTFTTIGDYAFWDCSSLSSVNIPDNVTSIGIYAFRGCSSLASIIIPDGITIIKGGTFNYCSSLTSITIPGSVTSIGNLAFNCCTSLTSIIIPDRVTSIENLAFMYCTSLASITIPDSVTSIGSWVFQGCSSLANVTFEGSIDANDFAEDASDGDLREKYLDETGGGPGTYTTTAPVTDDSVWTKVE